jgi:beta-phosphoglucomutase-like phosphatase (HAD superfamily)
MNTINWVFDKFDIGKYFMGKISGADLEESKPNPEIFIKASQIAVEPENCMVIEDSTNGIIASHRANIFCAAYKSEHSKLQKYDLANIVVSDFSDLEISKIQQYFI